MSENNNAVKANDFGTSAKDNLKKAGASVKATLKKFASPKFSAAYVAKMALLIAISFILYTYVKFSLPMIFPSFLDMQISELPALLAGFSMGPVSGCLVVIIKCLLKFPMSSTFLVGETTDILMGIALVLPSSIIYRIKKDKKHALIGLAVGTIAFVSFGLLINRFVSIPFYANLYGFDNVVRMVSALYKNVTIDNFYAYYLPLAVLPFNLIRCIIMSALTFLLYKRLSVLLHWEGSSLLNKSIFGVHKVKSVEDTYSLAKRVANTLDGGEVLLLDGDLGAGKTTFTKGLAAALGVKEEVTSPTFTILNVYESGRMKLNHLDMYRVESADELVELGVEDCFDEDAVTVIEWNKFEQFDGKVIKISISLDGEGRIFDISEDNKTDDSRNEDLSDENENIETNTEDTAEDREIDAVIIQTDGSGFEACVTDKSEDTE